MKVIAVFAAVLAVSSAQIIYNGGLGYAHAGYAHPGFAHHGLAYSSVVPSVAVAPVATKTQYHSQNELGEAAFGHSEPQQNHAAVRDAAGNVRGVFSYVSPEGIPFTTHYSAGHDGYRVASNALPVAPAVNVVGPVDTPEVSIAKAQHAAAHTDALIRAGRAKRGLVSTYNVGHVVAAPATFGYGYSTAVAHPVAHTIAAPAAITYSSAHVPAATVLSAPAVTYASHAVHAVPAVRSAVLTKIVNTPGHAVSYRVD